MEDRQMEDKSSMLYWWPKVKDSGVPMPETEIIEIDMSHRDIFGILDFDEDSLRAWKAYYPKIEEAIERVGIPAFLRTDRISGKHDWVETCYYDGSRRIESHISELVQCSAEASIVGIPVGALVVREYIPMKSSFTAFDGSMPVCPERRYFIRDGKVECHHPYWIADAIEKGTQPEDLPKLWKRTLLKMNSESHEEVELLTAHAISVAANLEGYWSVDFCQTAEGAWLFIDMAEGEKSWHPKCIHKEEQ
jgi:hypothetical protein